MTASSRVARVGRAIRHFVLGPWPLHVGALWTFLSVMILGVTWRLFGAQPMIEQQDPLSSRAVGILTVGLLAPGVLLVPLVIYRLIRRRITQRPPKWPEYLLALALASVIGAIVLNFVLRNSENYQDILNHPRLIDTSVRIFVPVWFINAVIGTVFARISKEATAAKDALQVVVAQRRLLLESEERVRGQVASYLHDRVQTDLVSIGLRIRAAYSLDAEDMRAELDSALNELERVRSNEVRKASRQLSPTLGHVTLSTALRELADAYQPGMKVTIVESDVISARLRDKGEISRATGIYRICEQGLLNAAIHGRASECLIQLTRTSRDEVTLGLSDNGVGLQGNSLQPGMGTTVISAWVEALGGQWSLQPASSGMTLIATFPCA